MFDKDWSEDLMKKAQDHWNAVLRYREVYVAAWVAEHGCQPSECMLVETRSYEGDKIITTIKVVRTDEEGSGG